MDSPDDLEVSSDKQDDLEVPGDTQDLELEVGCPRQPLPAKAVEGMLFHKAQEHLDLSPRCDDVPLPSRAPSCEDIGDSEVALEAQATPRLESRALRPAEYTPRQRRIKEDRAKRARDACEVNMHVYNYHKLTR